MSFSLLNNSCCCCWNFMIVESQEPEHLRIDSFLDEIQLVWGSRIYERWVSRWQTGTKIFKRKKIDFVI